MLDVSKLVNDIQDNVGQSVIKEPVTRNEKLYQVWKRSENRYAVECIGVQMKSVHCF